MNMNPNCVFCGKSGSQVAKLISIADAAICNECVELCTEVLRREMPGRTPHTDTSEESPGHSQIHSQVDHFVSAGSTEFRKMLKEMGPAVIDSSIRQGISMLWMALPESARNVEQFTEIVRQRYERILTEVGDDVRLFKLEESLDS